MKPQHILLTTGAMTSVGNFFRKQLLRFGRWVSPADDNEYMEITPELAQTMVANFDAKVYGDIPVLMDPHDDSHYAGPEFTKGFVRKLTVQSDGLYGDIEFLDPQAKELAAKGLIPGVSIELIHNYEDHEHDNKPVGAVLGHVAVCNAPYIKNMRGWEPIPDILCNDNKNFGVKHVKIPVLRFSEDKPVTLAELLKKLKDEHNIDVAALQTAAGKATKAETDLAEYKKTHPENQTDIEKDPKFVALNETVQKLTKDANDAAAKVLAMETQSKKEKAAAKVQKLMDDGKIVPADKDHYIMLAETNEPLFENITKGLKVVVDLSERGTSTDPHGSPVNKSLSAAEAKTTIDEITKTYLTKSKAAA